MRLLPSQQTKVQVAVLKQLLERGRLTLSEPCDCGSQIRHNNGGNYHDIFEFRLDAGKTFRAATWTGEHGPDLDWVEVSFTAAIEEIARCAAEGWHAD